MNKKRSEGIEVCPYLNWSISKKCSVSLVKELVNLSEATSLSSVHGVAHPGKRSSGSLEQRYLGYALDICLQDGTCQLNFKGAPETCYSVSGGVYSMRFSGDMVCELYSTAFCTDQNPKVIDQTADNIPGQFEGFDMKAFACRRLD
jgi:hypothetical protein